jgi:hypothetical protein
MKTQSDRSRGMSVVRHCATLSLALAALFSTTVKAQEVFTGRAGIEIRGFAQAPLYSGQTYHGASAFLEPELFLNWAGGDQRVVFSPFLRVDASDSRRTHLDVREAYWQWFGRSLEIRAGFARVFWGVTESRHLVDIINQTDGIEGLDGEAKLGQPMVQLTWTEQFGTLDLFMMPFFREHTFPGVDGRLRPPAAVVTNKWIRHERLDLAMRYAHYFGAFDLGVSGFWGTSREPLLAVDRSGGVLIPEYPTIRQVGIDVQWTRGAWLAKTEAIFRSGYGQNFGALVSGVEYTLGNVRETGIDVGILAEVHLDGRGDLMLGSQSFQATPFNDDIFGGVRLALNDVQSTSVLAGAVVDRGSGETSLFLEASRRLGKRMTAALDVRSFHHTYASSPLHFLRNDAFAQLRISYFF